MVETHISWVFLAGDFVYKVKKPVDFGFLDYSSLDLRRHFCHEEVRLNRRLCGGAYLGVVPIVERAGNVCVDQPGTPIEYAVWMRRLPAERMLDRLIRDGHASETMIERVAERVAAFHGQADRGPRIDPYGSLEAIRFNWDENFTQTEPYVGRAISARQFQGVRAYVEGFLSRHADLFGRRVADGRIRDCHGDMRAESICLTDELCIFDCIEFSERLRCGDTASELAFLAMDIDARGRPDLAYWLVDRYLWATGDPELRALLPFYASYRAFVRGKVQSFRLDQPVRAEGEHRTALRRARHYFELAYSYARVPEEPRLVLVCGLSGTGKTTAARALGQRLNAVVYSSDRVRKELAGVPATARGPQAFEAGLYAPAVTERTYARLTELAREKLSAGTSVVLDATFSRASDRIAAVEVARSFGIPACIVECRCAEPTVIERIHRRAASGEGASDADESVYFGQRGTIQPVRGDESDVHLVIDTEVSVPRLLRQMLSAVSSVPRRPRARVASR